MRTGGSDNDVDGDETPDRLLEPLFRSYIASQADLQTLRTRSGDLWSGGLNEPKFEADGGVFDGEWGRPQRWAQQGVGL
jgi:glucoamylase